MAALAAQSVGGGAGDAGANAGLHALGASGGFAGDGGIVRITNMAAVTIYDAFSAGPYAQSVGGGGGKGGMAFASGRSTTAIGGSGGEGGHGGAVYLNNMGSLRTVEINSFNDGMVYLWRAVDDGSDLLSRRYPCERGRSDSA